MWGLVRSEYVDFLTAEIVWLKAELKHERRRAEIALDRLLSLKQIGPVTPPERPPEDLALTTEMDALLNNPEFTQAGEA